MYDGLLDLGLGGYVAATLLLTHITIAAVTIFLHRHQAHRALDLHPAVSHFFRFWLWLTTGMVTKEWVAVHRKHHARTETEEDPHSPQVYGIRKVLLEGAELYRKAADDPALLAKYGHGTPDDWIERRLYSRHPQLGLGVMAAVDLVLFGVPGITVWAVQMLWIPFFAAGVINGLGHYWGYRNFEVPDTSTNISPIGLLIGGEELHNNHHAFPSSAKLSVRRWEFDIGWLYIRALQALGLARVKKVAPRPVIHPERAQVGIDTVRAVIAARFHVMADYTREVMLPVLREELRAADRSCRRLLEDARRALRRTRPDPQATRERLRAAAERSAALRTVHDYRERLAAIWASAAASNEQLRAQLAQWCADAEASGIEALERFARRLRGYSLAPQGA